MGRPQKKKQKSAELTPMMEQYMEIKAANPDTMLFYRMGDFYELFFEDAESASRVLGIQLTARGTYMDKPIPMAGVPVHAANDYLQRLIRSGFRVAVCEQLEDPAEAKKRGAKAVVKRDVVRLVTPGTLTEDTLLESSSNNFLTAVFTSRTSDSADKKSYALASVDISTGEFLISEVNESDVAGEIIRINPSEIITPDNLMSEPVLCNCAEQLKISLTPVPNAYFNSVSGEHDLKAALNVSALDGFGNFSRSELAAIAALLKYIELTQIGKKPILRPPVHQGPSAVLVIDAATRINLELIRTTSGEKNGSLLAAIDRTVTGPGARELCARLSSPLRDVKAIQNRLESIDFLKSDPALRSDIRKRLKGSPDIARAFSRLVLGRGGPRDLGTICQALNRSEEIYQCLNEAKNLAGQPDLLKDIASKLKKSNCQITHTLKQALADDLPNLTRDGDFIRPGFHAELDEARVLRDESRKIVASLQLRYANETGIKSIKIRHNNMLGYFVEATANNAKPLMSEPLKNTFIHRQTLANAVRFTTTELSETESQITNAAERALGIEQDIFSDLLRQVIEQEQIIIEISESLAELDVYCALAELAEEQNYIRPVIDNSADFQIIGGRHPVVDQALERNKEGPFIANDCILSQEKSESKENQEQNKAGRLWIVTGPNMAGKSTFLRQNALITLLAQMGSFVPAEKAHIGIVDRLFSRVGASDDLARGRSTFMVEMVETAAILNQATDKSLVILDEIGRGTATFDGLSIAWATVEYLHEVSKCRALFATHYHELTALAGQLEQAINTTIEVKEWQDEIVFLYKVIKGAADRSYGIQVAKLAGLPAPVITRAGEVLKLLEDNDKKQIKESLIEDLPLFAATRPESVTADILGNSDAISPKAQKIEHELDEINPDMLTPKEALDILYKLKSLE